MKKLLKVKLGQSPSYIISFIKPFLIPYPVLLVPWLWFFCHQSRVSSMKAETLSDLFTGISLVSTADPGSWWKLNICGDNN